MFTGLSHVEERKGRYHEAYVALERLYAHPDVFSIDVQHRPPELIVTRMDDTYVRFSGRKSFTRVCCAALAEFFGDDA